MMGLFLRRKIHFKLPRSGEKRSLPLTDNVVEPPMSRRLVFFALLGLFEDVRAVGHFVKVLFRLVSRVEHGTGRHAEHFDDLVHLVHLIGARKERLPRVHLDEDAAQGPHVNGQVVRNAQEDLWRPVEPRLDVLVDLKRKKKRCNEFSKKKKGSHGVDYPLAELARAAEIDDLDGGSLWIAEEDVLGLEVAVDDAQLGRRQEQESRAELLGEFARQVEGNSAEVGVAQQIVEVVGEELKDEAQVVPPHKVPL